MRIPVLVVALVAVATPATAQSSYVGATLVLDVVRYDRTEYNEPRITSDITSTDGEAPGVGLQVGRALGERWGVEFEFARSGQIDNRHSRVYPLLPDLRSLPVPDVAVEFETEHRITSYSALAWVRQNLGDRVELTFLGGVAFTRVVLEQRFEMTDDRLAQWVALLPNVTSIAHGTSPAAGVHTSVKISESAAVTAGVRMHGATVMGRGGWQLRPSVGVRWAF